MSHETQIKGERTFFIIKPDAVQRGLVGEITKRLERIGLKLVAVKTAVATPEHVEEHYTLDPEWKRITGEKTIAGYKKKGMTPPSEDPLEITDAVLKGLKVYMTSGPIVCMVWEGPHAVKIVRKIVGGTEPLTSDVGTIRGDYVIDSYQMADADNRAVRNLVHASGSVAEAENEIKHWFKPEEIIDYKLIQEQVMYAPEIEGVFGK